MPPTTPYKIPQTTPSQTKTALQIALEIHNLLAPLNQTLATAESTTAGLLSLTISSVPDASAIYRGSINPNTTPLHQTLLNISPNTLRKEGVVSASVAAQMALGVLQKTSCHGVATTWGLSTAGIIGLERQDGVPPEMVYIGIAYGESAEGLGPFYFEGNSNDVRQAAVLEALVQLRIAILASRP